VFIGNERIESYDYLRTHVRDVVYCGGASGVPDYNSVSFDGYHGIMNMVGHLHSLGYRRMGYITGGRGDERQRGYQDAVRAFGLSDERTLVANVETGLSGWLPETGTKGAQQLMTQPHPPDAIICASDRLAMGANQWLQQNGIQVPHDIALTGFDNILEAEFVVPPLTTLHVHKRAMGALAVERLIHALEHPDDLPLSITMPTHLVIRESCGVNLSRA
jgi:DNA-binding LacI/PurR family transcriptional regulator